MKPIKYIILLLISYNGFASDCPTIDNQLLSNSLSTRQSQLQDAMDDCPNLTTAIQLAKTIQQSGENTIAEEVMLDALNDVVKTDRDRGTWLIGSIDIAISSKNTCQASQHLNELKFISGFENDYKNYRKKLYASTQNQVLSSQTIGCALAETRSVTYRGMKIKPKIDLAIHFDFNSDKLTEKGRQQSQQLADALSKGKLKNSTLQLIGHTDSIGTAAYNLDLSQRRSQSVKIYLLTIDASFNSKISTNGLGETQLLSQGTSDADHQLNRRVEIQLK